MKPLLFLLALIPALAHAETFVIDTKVSEVTVYPQGAEITRTGEFDLPAGRHRLVFLGIPMDDSGQHIASMNVQADGLTQTAVIIRRDDVPWHDYMGEEVKQIEQLIESIEAQIMEVEDRADVALIKANAANAKISFLADLGRNEGLAGSNVSNLRDIAQMIGEESQSAEQARHDAEIESREILKQLEDLEHALEAAQADLASLLPETEERMFLAVDVLADRDTSGPITVSYFDSYNAVWQPAYEFDLATEGGPQVTIKRNLFVIQTTGENWNDITLHISTLRPTEDNSASNLFPRRRSIWEKPDPVQARNNANLEEPVVEAPVIVEETQGWISNYTSVEDTGFTYTFSEPISIASSQDEIIEFELDTMTQGAELFAVATPSRDDVAFRTARFTNPYAQPLFATEMAKWFVDGVLVATNYSVEIGPLAEVEMGFGPIHGLALDRVILDRSSGDTGLITRSNQRVERARIEVENLTDQSWPLRIQDQVPYSEQEDLTITWTATPQPTEENLNDRRGILAWDVELAPGQSQIITLDTTLNWPEGMDLR